MINQADLAIYNPPMFFPLGRSGKRGVTVLASTGPLGKR
jgi:hypothetical protein